MVEKNVALIVLLGAAASLGFIAAYLVYGESKVVGVADGTSGHDPVEAELAELQTKAERLDAALAGARSPLTGKSRRVNGPPREMERLPNEAEMALERNKRRAAYDTSFNSQQVNPAWAASMEAALMESMVTDHLLSSTFEMPDLREVRCRSDICRLKFEFKGSADATDWADTYLTELGGTVSKAWYATESNPNGSTELVMYGFK